jgi:hypothetical protein
VRLWTYEKSEEQLYMCLVAFCSKTPTTHAYMCLRQSERYPEKFHV